MKRQIIEIDEDKCDGCGLCSNGCPEGALKVVNGKARLVGELLCDGLGACISICPRDAMTITEKEAMPYDENKVMDNIVKQGKDVIAAHLHHLKSHGQHKYYQQALAYLKEKGVDVPMESGDLLCGCPGTMAKDLRKNKTTSLIGGDLSIGPSQLGQWPVQLKLLNPLAPYFDNADLLVCADCVPFALSNFHERFLKNKILIVFCPKLDNANEAYIDKMANIFMNNNIKSITILHMEVPCCMGTVKFVEEALKVSGKNIIIKDYTISINGEMV